jgi:hypothetical protein
MSPKSSQARIPMTHLLVVTVETRDMYHARE